MKARRVVFNHGLRCGEVCRRVDVEEWVDGADRPGHTDDAMRSRPPPNALRAILHELFAQVSAQIRSPQGNGMVDTISGCCAHDRLSRCSMGFLKTIHEIVWQKGSVAGHARHPSEGRPERSRPFHRGQDPCEWTRKPRNRIRNDGQGHPCEPVLCTIAVEDELVALRAEPLDHAAQKSAPSEGQQRLVGAAHSACQPPRQHDAQHGLMSVSRGHCAYSMTMRGAARTAGAPDKALQMRSAISL